MASVTCSGLTASNMKHLLSLLDCLTDWVDSFAEIPTGLYTLRPTEHPVPPSPPLMMGLISTGDATHLFKLRVAPYSRSTSPSLCSKSDDRT